MTKPQLFKSIYDTFVVVMWVLTLIVGNLADFYGKELLSINIFASAAVCFSAMACLRASDVLRVLKENER